MRNTLKVSFLLLLVGLILSGCGPFWDLTRDPDVSGPSWDVTVELPIAGKTEETRIEVLKYVAEYLGLPFDIKRYEGPVALIDDMLDEIGPIDIELPAETEDLVGKWILHAEIFADIEYVLPFGADVTISFSEDRASLFSDPAYKRTVRLPLSGLETAASTLISLDFDLTQEELQSLFKGVIFIGASAELLLPEGALTIIIDRSHYIWPKVWATVDARVNPKSE